MGVLGVVASVGGGTSITSQGSAGILGPATGVATSTSSILSIVGIVVEALALLAFMAIIGLVIIIVVPTRADPDPSGRRPQSVYYFAVSFVTLVTSIIVSIVVVFSLI